MAGKLQRERIRRGRSLDCVRKAGGAVKSKEADKPVAHRIGQEVELMARIWECKCPNGARVIINDAYLPRDAEERERNRRKAWEVAYAIAGEQMAKAEAERRARGKTGGKASGTVL